MGKKIAILAMLGLVMGVSGTVLAQGRPILTVPRQSTPSPPPVELLNQPLTSEQAHALYGPRGTIRPGTYNIMWQGGCLTPGSYDRHSFGPQFPTIEGCRSSANAYTAAVQYITILPSPDGGMVLHFQPPNASIPEGPCLTVARAVVFGAPRLDLLKCEGNGAADQRFSILGVGPNDQFEVRPWRPSVFEADCLTVRPGDAAQLELTDLVVQRCGAENQRVIVRYLSTPQPLANQSATQRMLESQGWFLANDGYRRLAPVAGVDLPGSELRSIPSGPNGARSCASLCLADNSCRAFTWHPGSLKLGSVKAPKCVLKSTYGQPNNAGGTGTNRVTSGIVRPQ